MWDGLVTGKRKRQKAQTREKLKEATMALCKTQSITSLSPVQITKEAGVASGTFYVHFTNRDELVDEIVHDLDMSFQQACIDCLLAMPDATMRQGSRLLAHRMLSFYEERFYLTPLVMEHAARHGHKKLLGTNNRMREALAAAAKFLNAELSDTRADLHGHAMQNLWRQIALRGVYPDETSEEVVEALLDMTGALWDTVAPGFFHREDELPIQTLVTMLASHMNPSEEE